MANQTGGPVWILDTQSTTAISTPAGAKITEIRWVGATAASHTVRLTDRNNCILFWGCAQAVASENRSTPNITCNGIIPVQIDSGRVCITFQ